METILILLLFSIPFLPGLILVIVGFTMQKEKPDLAKKFFIAGGLYLLISLGICATILMG